MTEYLVTADPSAVDFFPSSAVAEVLQNVRMILATQKGTVPLDRNFGLSWDAVSAPPAVARARITTEVIQQINRYEPRAKVIKIQFETSNAVEGQLRPRVVIGVNA